MLQKNGIHCNILVLRADYTEKKNMEARQIEQIIVASSSLLAIIAVSAAVVKVMQVMADNRLKRALIEEGVNEVPEFMSLNVFMKQQVWASLKWALMLLFLAFGLLTSSSVLEVCLDNPAFYGYLVLWVGLGQAVYFLWLSKKLKSEAHEQA